MSGRQYSQLVRPGQGTQGKPTVVTVNAFITTIPKLIVHHYDIATSPGDLPQPVGREIFRHLSDTLKIFGPVATVYDGRKNIYSPKILKFEGDIKSLSIDLPEADGGPAAPTRGGKPGRHFKITIKKVAEVNLYELQAFINREGSPPASSQVLMAINALNVLCNHDIRMRHASKGSSFFPKPTSQSDQLSLSQGLEMWRGYFSSLRMAPGKLILNFDLTSQPMVQSGNLIKIALAITGNRDPRDLARLEGQKFLNLQRALNGVKVTIRYSGGKIFKKKVKSLTRESAGNLKFQVEDGSSVTVKDYFMTTYNVRLRNPELPCVRVSSKACYPLELCEIESGQKFSRRLSPDQLKEAIKWLTIKPDDRQARLMEGLRSHMHPAVTPTIGHWGLKIEPQAMRVKARILPPPQIVLKTQGRDAPFQPRDGVWDMRQKSCFVPAAPIQSWVVVVFSNQSNFFNQELLRHSIDGFMGGMKNVGVQISPPSNVVWAGKQLHDLRGKDLGGFLKSTVSRPPKLFLIYLDDRHAWQYSHLKRFGDVETGVATQCLAIEKVKKGGNSQYYGNVALKVNVKLGGLNQVLTPRDLGPIAEVPTIVFGADVTHPSPDSASPSVAAVVASLDSRCSIYSTQFRVQRGRVEIIMELEHMAFLLLQEFFKKSKRKPERIFFYRDGVSEGQFGDVILDEIPQIRAACRRLDPQYSPKITFIVCGKRHHFKFGPTNPSDADRSGNLKPGLVVDTDVTHPFDFDWYGQSHAGLLGTSKSSHYSVLVDDSQFSADVLQKITYNLCYTYARATRSVSIVPPAYYAHHVCTRAKLWITNDDEMSADMSVLSGDRNSTEALMLQQYRDRASTLQNSANRQLQTMYFM